MAGLRALEQQIGPYRRYLPALLAVTAATLTCPARIGFAAEHSAVPGPALAGLPSSAAQTDCLGCHRVRGKLVMLPSGERLGLYVDEGELGGSVHAGKLVCTDCHSRIASVPHRKVQVGSKREYSMAQYEACRRCHFANYTKTLDSIHYKTREGGNREAPLCTDCHGSHGVMKPDEPRSKISTSCGSCHKGVYGEYSKSVHGAALENGQNGDVPVCTDCHGTHTIRNAETASFRLSSPEMCGKCHRDGELMAKYGLSPNVFKTYLQDFHGVTVSLTRRQGPDNWTDKAVCSDCHGVHDIMSVKQRSAAELKENVVASCRKCHPEAGTNFPDAWLSHYELTFDKEPLAWLVRASYSVLIPFMIVGLALHIVADLWRIARNR